MKSILFTIVFIMVLVVSACEKVKVDEKSRIAYGTSFGMCAGYCIRSMVIGDGKVVFTKSQNGTIANQKVCTQAISEKDFQRLLQFVNHSGIKKLPETIGCPDCADGGAEWISFTSDGKTYRVNFEYQREPAELKPVVAKLRELFEGFKDCN